MTKLTIAGFRGAVKALSARLLPDANSVVCENARLARGNLLAFNVPFDTTATLPAGRLGLYRMGRDAPSDTTYWLSWTTFVDVMRGFVPNDTTEKTVYTGAGTPKWTDNTMALATPPYPTAFRELGVPAPVGAPVTAINTNGPNTQPARDVNVVVTFLTDHGEEGSISSPSITLSVYPGATINVSAFPTAPAGAYGITKIRVYATDIGNASENYAFAAEIAYGTSTVTINMGSLGSVLETTDYDMPPADGHSLTALWNAFAAMASGKAVYFCVPSTIYAWPQGQRMLIPNTIVGLAAFDQTLLVLTTADPVLIQGSDPTGMSETPSKLSQSCVSKRSIVAFGHGVAWASPDGLMYVSSSGPLNLTQNVMIREDWQKLVPSTIVGNLYEGLYLGTYDDGSGRKGFLVDPNQPDGIVFLPTTAYQAMFQDDIVDALFGLNSTHVEKWDRGATPMTVVWTSKSFRQIDPVSFAWARVVANAAAYAAHFTIDFYCTSDDDGNGGGAVTHTYTRTITSGKPFRLPQGFSGNDWQIRVTLTAGQIDAVLMAETIREVSA